MIYQSQHEILDHGFKHLRQLFIIVSAFRWHLVLSFMLLALSSWFSILAVVAVVVLAITTEDKIHIHAQKTQIKRCESGRSALTLLSASKLIHYLAHNCTRWQVTLSSTNYLNASRLIFALCTKLQTVLSQIVQH